MKQTVIAIDPSSRKCGVAILRDKQILHLATINATKKDGDYTQRSLQIAQKIARLNNSYVPRIILIELPSHFSGTRRGRAARNSSAILKLTFTVATIATTLALQHSQAEVRLVPVRTWKGQAPKHITQARLKQRFPNHPLINKADHNALDALGIASWWYRKGHKIPRKTIPFAINE